MNRIGVVAALTAVLAAAPALAQEPVGCDKFKWPLDRERALLTAPDARMVASGAEIGPPVDRAVKITLGPPADVRLPMPPGRAPRTDSKAGFVTVAGLQQAGSYRITLSAGGWLDVVQNSRFVKSGAFSGALGCEGVRKSVTFALEAAPFVVQVSGVRADAVGMVITPAGP